YTNGRNVRDEYSLIMTFRQNFTPDLVDPAAIDPVEGRVILPFPKRTDNSFPLPLFTDDGYALLNDPSRYEFGRGVWSRNTGRNKRITGEFSTVYAADAGVLTYVEAG